MINDPIELAAMKQTTLDLIESDHIALRLVRHEWTRTPAGGMKESNPTELDPQTVFFGATTGDPRVIQNASGEMIVASHVMVGVPEADVEPGDEFRIAFRNYRVLDIHPDRSYQTKAWVVERGTNGTT